MRYLITGGQGFLGRYLVAHLLNQYPDSYVAGMGRSPRCDDFFTHEIHVDNQVIKAPLPPGLSMRNHPRYQYVSMNIEKTGSLTTFISDFSPEIVIHLASGLRDDPPEKLCRVNIEGTLSLLRAIKQSPSNPKKIVLGSSGGVYGIPKSLPMAEDANCAPQDFYSITKSSSEQISALFAKQENLPVCWARIFNIVGPGQDERHVVGRFVSLLTAKLKPKTLEVGRLDTTRDFIDVRDVARAMDLLGRNAIPGESYNVGSGNETAIQTILDTITQLLDFEVKVESTMMRPGDIPRHVASVEKIREIGFSPKIPLHQAIQDVISYYLNLQENAP